MSNQVRADAKFRMGHEHRLKIANSNILNALIEHAEGNRDMSQTQVTAGIALLKKVLPDMATISHTGADGEGPVEHRVTVSLD